MSQRSGVDPIILGHNPFFGVDHLSQSRGNEKDQRFSDVQRITEILEFSQSQGVTGLMMSTHPRAALVTAAMRKQPDLVSKWQLYPLVPYVQKYVRGSNEKGLFNLVRETLSQASLGQRLGFALRSGRGLLERDLDEMFGVLVDVELLPFKGLNLGGVFLHDALTDLALGLGREDRLELFRKHVEKQYGVRAGFATKNLPLFRERVARFEWREPLVMASFNAIGFYVNPSLEQFQRSLREPGLTFAAMNTLASGRLRPEDAYSYLADFPEVQSVVVGMSRRDHVEQTVATIDRHMPWLRSAR